MQVKTYGLFDGVAQEYVRTFVAKSDELAKRACKYIVREPGFDEIAGRDYVVSYLYTMDSETGIIIDNSIHSICALASEIDAFKVEKAAAKLEEGEQDGEGK